MALPETPDLVTPAAGVGKASGRAKVPPYMARPRPEHIPPSGWIWQPSTGWTPPPPMVYYAADPARRGTLRYRTLRRGTVSLALISGAVAVALVVTGLITGGPFGSRRFETTSLEQGVLAVVRDTYLLDVEQIACPRAVPVRPGLRFSCNILADGQAGSVTVRVLDDSGRYEVVRPV
ncbi:DUF4333 domain-containing protein [Paractinoplanes brasiliensis]|uniref:Uncharacterized protein DUF4333 n=1 Tax=Paractinoplanes brasiliensis TaxID=52695 RepID=A0A4R6JMU0_9ACTN|nr:DUF4333 domain-containing protein [Actinoplanes brasiliensis]TDO37052.1 uncharacterized protein DUF4333 [Actinoplanes brasiliensis]GID32254.1 hypothetical protein Abr02nite_72370 [Actinoplanes brasiliensis]